jgi:preprotein translocase subunit SecE
MAKTSKTAAAGAGAGKGGGKSGAKSDGKPQTIEGAAEEVPKKKKSVTPLQYFRQVMDEGRKVTWTTWRETYISTGMVLVMVFIMAAFFFLVDMVLRFGVKAILSL